MLQILVLLILIISSSANLQKYAQYDSPLTINQIQLLAVPYQTNSNVYLLSQHQGVDINSIVYGAGSLDLEKYNNNPVEKISNWQIRLITVTNSIGFQLKLEDNRVIWRLQINYFIIDQTRTDLYPILENLKITQKPLMKNTDSQILLTFTSKYQQSISKDNNEAQQIVPVTFLRGFSIKNNKNSYQKIKINIKGNVVSDKMIHFINEIYGIEHYLITVLVINRLHLIKQNLILHLSYQIPILAPHHEIGSMKLLKQIQLGMNAQTRFNLKFNQNQLLLSKITCPQNSQINPHTLQCNLLQDSIQMEPILAKQARVLDSSSCVENCPVQVPCPNNLKRALVCVSINGQTFIKKCDPGYYTPTYYGDHCQPCTILSDCLECRLSYYSSKLKCSKCIPGYTPVDGICVPCPPGCAECQFNQYGSAHCSSCLTNLGFVIQQTQCSSVCGCLSTSYLRTTPIPATCIPCSSPCLTCTSQTSCKSCLVGFVFISPNCVGCMPICKTCSNLSSCKTCLSDSYMGLNSICSCNSGLFFDIATQSCKSCQAIYPNCETCSYNGTYSAMNPPIVLCIKAKPFYYLDPISGVISSCMANCLNCSSGISTCVQCKANFIYFNMSCECDINLFYNANNQQCQACNLIIQGCSSCNQFPIPTQTTCSDCMMGYFQTGLSTPFCQKCDSLCQNCTGIAACTDCINNLIVDNTTGYCHCNPLSNQFFHPLTKQCIICNLIIPNCMTCNLGLIVTCQVCENQFYVDPTGFLCKPCPANCTNCTNENSCSACQPGYTKILTSCVCQTACQTCLNASANACSDCDTTNSAICNNCAPGYYLVVTTCNLCQSSFIPYCFECSNATTCQTCRQPFIKLSNGACDCNNTKNEFVTSSVPATCLPCSQVINSCTQCDNILLPHKTICLVCQDTYFLANDTCHSCSIPCKNCETTAVNCLTCAPTYQLVNGSCICRNELEIFKNNKTEGCSVCSQVFQYCSDCEADNSAIGITCLDCLGAYFFNQLTQKCEACPEECLKCTNETACTSCIEGFVEIDSKCVCNNSATPPYYLSMFSQTCLLCQEIISGCTNCTFNNSIICNQCKPGTYLDGLFCTPCHVSCASCNDTACLSCPPGTTLDDGHCICGTNCQECSIKSLNCLQCNITNNVISSCSSCIPGYFPSGTSCLMCPLSCITCSSDSQCIICRSNYILTSSGMCECLTQEGLYPERGLCKLCQTIYYGCTECEINPSRDTICVSCMEGYFVSANQCLVCSSNCKTCQVNTNNCTTCLEGLTLVNGVCQCTSAACLQCQGNSSYCINCLNHILGNFIQCLQCKGGFYLNDTACIQCPSACLTCDEKAECITCKDTFQALNGTCQCNNEKQMWLTSSICKQCNLIHSYCQICFQNSSNPTNVSCSKCIIGYYLQDDACFQSICSDGRITTGEACDDGNLIDGDGCSQFCQIEEFFQCSGTPSVCYVDLDFQITLDGIRVDPVICNRVSVSFTMHPIYEGYKTANFSKMLNYIKGFRHNYLNWQSWSYEEGVVTYSFEYKQNLHNRVIQFYFQPQNLGLNETKRMPIMVIPVYFASTNNIPAFLVDKSTCEKKQTFQTLANTIQYSSYATLILSALPCKIVGLQLFGVLQLAHLSVGNMDNVNTMLTPLMSMKGVHGLNIDIDDKEKTPNQRQLQTGSALTPERVKSIGYSSNFLRNCNLMFIIVFCLILVSFTLFIIVKFCQNCAPFCYSLMRRIAKQVLLTLILFNCYNFAYSAGIHYNYASKDDDLYTLGTLVATLTIIIPFAMCFVLAFSQEQGFGQYKDKLKNGVLEKSYFIITILYRTGMGIYVASMNQDQQSALIVLGISILFLLYNLVNLPFVKAYHNYRANICHLTQFVCLFITLYYRSMISTKKSSEIAVTYTPAYIQYSCILISFLVSFIVLIYQVYLFIKECMDSKQKKKVNSRVETEDGAMNCSQLKEKNQNDDDEKKISHGSNMHIEFDMIKGQYDQ